MKKPRDVAENRCQHEAECPSRATLSTFVSVQLSSHTYGMVPYIGIFVALTEVWNNVIFA